MAKNRQLRASFTGAVGCKVRSAKRRSPVKASSTPAKFFCRILGRISLHRQEAHHRPGQQPKEVLSCVAE
jgi:hypothetical protein